jgi:hypothetical protein
MNRLSPWLRGLAYCILSTIIGASVGAVAGVGIAGMLLRPEEAVVLYAGVSYGVPLGALAGLAMGVIVAVRHIRARR